MRRLLVLAALALAGNSHATSYFVSDCASGAASQCVAGNDANPGTSPSAPWQSCAKVKQRFPTLAAGDQVLFGRGTAQPSCSMDFLSNFNSRANNPIVIGAYTPSWAVAGAAAPILSGMPSSYTIGFLNAGDATHDEGYVIQDLHLIGPGVSSSVAALIMGNDVDYVTIQRIEVEGYRLGIQCAGGTNHPLSAGSDGKTEHIVILNSSIHHNRGMGLLLACNDSLIENNMFDNNGVNMLDHQIYLDDAAINNIALSTNQVVIRGNILTNNSPYASASAAMPTPGGCKSVAVVVHGLKDGITVENNAISEPTLPPSSGCWGITVDSGAYSGIYSVEGFKNILIRGNTVINYTMGIGVDLCDRCVVENNYVYSEHVGANGIIAPSKYFNSAIAGNTLNNRLTVRNNTIYLKNPNSGSTGIRISRDGSGHVLASNLIYFGAGSGAGTSCFNATDLAPAAFISFDYNLCYFAGVPGKWETGRGTLATQRAAGLDMHSQASNPDLPVPVAPRFSVVLLPGSPALKSGHPTLSSEFAIGGLKRTGASDIGAVQQGAGVIVPNTPTGMIIQ